MKKVIPVILSLTITVGSITSASAQSIGLPTHEMTILKLKAEDKVQKMADLNDRILAIQNYYDETWNVTSVLGTALAGSTGALAGGLITFAITDNGLNMAPMKVLKSSIIGSAAGSILAVKASEYINSKAYREQLNRLPQMSEEEILADYRLISAEMIKLDREVAQILQEEQRLLEQ